MALQIKVHGATPKSGRSLCHTCKQAQVVTGQNCEEYIHCSADIFKRTGDRVPFRVSQCTAFHPANMPWKYEMEEMAWKVEARKRGPSGFKSPDGEMEYLITPPKRQGDPE